MNFIDMNDEETDKMYLNNAFNFHTNRFNFW